MVLLENFEEDSIRVIGEVWTSCTLGLSTAFKNVSSSRSASHCEIAYPNKLNILEKASKLFLASRVATKTCKVETGTIKVESTANFSCMEVDAYRLANPFSIGLNDLRASLKLYLFGYPF
jgi:hypothetical protein